MGNFNDGSYSLVFNESDGSLIQKTRLGEAGGHRRYPGPRGTSTVDDSQVFVLNQHSSLACLDIKNGEKRTVNLVKKYGGEMMSSWKYSESPLVDGEQVICTPGGSGGTVLALDRQSGNRICQTEGWTDPAGYSCVINTTIDKTHQYVQLTGKGVAGINPDTGMYFGEQIVRV